ncbi:MAG: leucyl/phenylalanyl-tRNA--protein transferase, partial [Pseudomonadota bacterium]
MHSPLRPAIPVDTLLLAYRSGIFPMADTREDQDVFWVEPRDRAIIPLDGLHVSKSLKKVIRSDRFIVTLDQAFERVIRACAAPRPGHPESWISDRIVRSYLGLHRAGYAHSIECWDSTETAKGSQPELLGGLYGVAFDRVFCGESMFSRADNASKVALSWLVALLRHANYRVLDCQFMTDHLGTMGAIEMPQRMYLRLL